MESTGVAVVVAVSQPTIDNLPDELILEIVKHLDDISLAVFATTSIRYNGFGLEELAKRNIPYSEEHIKFIATRPELFELMSDKWNQPQSEGKKKRFEQYLQYKVFPRDWVDAEEEKKYANTALDESNSSVMSKRQKLEIPPSAFSLDRVYLLINTHAVHSSWFYMENVLHAIAQKAQKHDISKYPQLFNVVGSSSSSSQSAPTPINEYFEIEITKPTRRGARTAFTKQNIYFMRLFLDGQYTPAFIADYDFEFDLFTLLKEEDDLRCFVDTLISDGDSYFKSFCGNHYEQYNKMYMCLVERKLFAVETVIHAPCEIRITLRQRKCLLLNQQIDEKIEKDKLSFSYLDRWCYCTYRNKLILQKPDRRQAIYSDTAPVWFENKLVFTHKKFENQNLYVKIM